MAFAVFCFLGVVRNKRRQTRRGGQSCLPILETIRDGGRAPKKFRDGGRASPPVCPARTPHAWHASKLSPAHPSHTQSILPQVNLSPGQNPPTRSVNTPKLHARAYLHGNTRDLNSASMSHSPTPNCYA